MNDTIFGSRQVFFICGQRPKTQKLLELFLLLDFSFQKLMQPLSLCIVIIFSFFLLFSITITIYHSVLYFYLHRPTYVGLPTQAYLCRPSYLGLPTCAYLPAPTYLGLPIFVYLPSPTYLCLPITLSQHTYLPLTTYQPTSTCLPTCVFLPTHTNPCQPTIIYLRTCTNL